jgi:hypothetical protein
MQIDPAPAERDRLSSHRGVTHVDCNKRSKQAQSTAVSEMISRGLLMDWKEMD